MVSHRTGTGTGTGRETRRVEGKGGGGLHHIQRMKPYSPYQLFQQRSSPSSFCSSSSCSSSSSCGSSDSSDQETNPFPPPSHQQAPLTRKERNRLSAMESRNKKEKLIHDLSAQASALQIENQHLHSLLSQALHLLHSRHRSSPLLSSSFELSPKESIAIFFP
jgi:hypothetical protein